MRGLQLEYMIFEDQIEPKGYLTRDKRAHACWYYFVLATKNRADVGKGPESQTIVVPSHDEGSVLWMDKRYAQIARSVAMLYGLNSPDDFTGYWPLVEKEARRLGIEVHDDVRFVDPTKRLDS